jgi:predicted nuclease of predicted toxin-antitoxin system
VRLLFDANIAPHLCRVLNEDFPGSKHVFDCGGIHDDDAKIWDYAKSSGYTIVSKDGDFSRMSLLLGAPPQVIWLRIGNCSTRTVEALMRKHAGKIEEMSRLKAVSLLILE